MSCSFTYLIYIKGNEYTFKGDYSVKIVLAFPFENGSTLKGKNLLLLGANSFLL